MAVPRNYLHILRMGELIITPDLSNLNTLFNYRLMGSGLLRDVDVVKAFDWSFRLNGRHLESSTV